MKMGTSEIKSSQLLFSRLLCFILERYGGYLSQANHTDLSDLLEEFSDDTSPLVNENSKDDNVQLIRPLPIIR